MPFSAAEMPRYDGGAEYYHAMVPYLNTNQMGEKNKPDGYLNLEYLLPNLNQSYVEAQTTEPLSDDMLHLLRQELETEFYIHAAVTLRTGRESANHWSYIYDMVRFRSTRRLPLNYFESERYLPQFFNKYTTIYFTAPSRIRGYEDRKLGRYIFHRWLQMHSERPPLQRYHYFAKAITFATRKVPQTIQEIKSFHESFCDSISARVDDPIQLKPKYEHWPLHDGVKRPWKDYGYTLGHLFRAIFIVVDPDVIASVNYEDRPNPPEDDESPPERIAEWLLPQCTVLLVKTGDDKHLSSPVDFQSLIDSGATLKLNRKDVEEYMEEGSVVRVKIDVAMQFIVNLMHREEDAIPRIRQAAKDLREEVEEGCRQWIDRVIKHAQKVGVDGNTYTWWAVRKLKARLNGEKFYKFEDFRFWHRLYADDR